LSVTVGLASGSRPLSHRNVGRSFSRSGRFLHPGFPSRNRLAGAVDELDLPFADVVSVGDVGEVGAAAAQVGPDELLLDAAGKNRSAG
jgi:hypothetical protein